MTVGELKKRLSGYPDDYMVVWDSTKPNSVLLTWAPSRAEERMCG